MARPRTGNLQQRGVNWFARVTHNGKREWMNLNCPGVPKATAARKLARLLQAIDKLDPSVDIADAVSPAGTVDACAEVWLGRLESAHKTSAKDERGRYEHHIKPHIGSKRCADVSKHAIEAVLENARANGLARETIRKLLKIMRSVFAVAIDDDLVTKDPTARVKPPDTGEVKRKRYVLADEQVARFLESDAPIDLRQMAHASRFIGGMRTGDVSALDWQHIDRVDFVFVDVARGKTEHERESDTLAVDAITSTMLRERWEAAGKPDAGPVFGIERRNGDKAKGSRRAERISHVKRLRRELMLAGVIAHNCKRDPNAPPPKRSEVFKWANGGAECCENLRHDPIYRDQAKTRCVDFHSFRRAYVTGCTRAGMSTQTIKLHSGHKSEKVLRDYTDRQLAREPLPPEALPKLSAPPRLPPKRTPKGSSKCKVLAPQVPEPKNDSTENPMNSARPPRLERGTRGLEGRCSIQLSYGRSERGL